MDFEFSEEQATIGELAREILEAEATIDRVKEQEATATAAMGLAGDHAADNRALAAKRQPRMRDMGFAGGVRRGRHQQDTIKSGAL